MLAGEDSGDDKATLRHAEACRPQAIPKTCDTPGNGHGASGTPWSCSECSAHLLGMTTQPHPISGLDPLLIIEDLAQHLGVPVTTIYDWRVDGKGPCAVRVGRHMRFTRSDVLASIQAQREARPGEPADRR